MIDYLLKENYFIGGMLPIVKIGQPPEMTFSELDQLLKMNLSEADYEQALSIRRYSDFENIRRYLHGDPLDPHGILNEKEIEEALLTREGYPSYLFDFLDKYTSDEERLRHLSELLSMHYEDEIENASGFIKDYMTFERDWRRVFAILRAKKRGSDEFLEDEEEIPEVYLELVDIFEKFSDSPMELQRALYEYRFQKIEQMCGIEIFTLKRILGTMIQLILVEKWEKQDQQKGKEFIDKLIGKA